MKFLQTPLVYVSVFFVSTELTKAGKGRRCFALASDSFILILVFLKQIISPLIIKQRLIWRKLGANSELTNNKIRHVYRVTPQGIYLFTVLWFLKVSLWTTVESPRWGHTWPVEGSGCWPVCSTLDGNLVWFALKLVFPLVQFDLRCYICSKFIYPHCHKYNKIQMC